MTDLIGNKSDTIVQNYTTQMLSDFNHDFKVDVVDLALFIQGWNQKNLDFELGPVIGSAPNFILNNVNNG